MAAYFRGRQPELVGLTFRNVDDCFWPSARSFLPVLERDVAAVRAATDAPIVLGGVGYSLFAPQILERTKADFGIRGDGEESLAVLWTQLRGDRNWSRVPGLVYREGAVIRTNPPAWPPSLPWVSRRDFVDNVAYFQRGGQLGWKPSGVARAAASTAPTRWPKGKRIGCGIPRSWPTRSASCCSKAWT